ncbi:hypothetical protein JMUB7516_27170 [Staphylococcus aureus]
MYKRQTQKSYVSEVEQQNSKSVLWGVKANEFVTPDGKKSAHDRYLFVQSPNGPTGSAREYFAPDNQLPPLIQSGFNRYLIAATIVCLLYTSPSPRDYAASRMPSSA